MRRILQASLRGREEKERGPDERESRCVRKSRSRGKGKSRGSGKGKENQSGSEEREEDDEDRLVLELACLRVAHLLRNVRGSQVHVAARRAEDDALKAAELAARDVAIHDILRRQMIHCDGGDGEKPMPPEVAGSAAR